MRNKYSLLFCLLLFAFISCKKDKIAEKAPEPNEFTSCNCTIQAGKAAPDEYLKATINGVQICADIKQGYQDSFDNMFSYGTIKRTTGDTYYDNVYMIRSTSDGKFRLLIFLENTHLLTKQFPYALPRANPEVCELGEMQAQNLLKPIYNSCALCPVDNWQYQGSFFDNQLSFIADKYEDGFFEGRFGGMIRTASGKAATVKDGRFRIKLTLIHQDIIIP